MKFTKQITDGYDAQGQQIADLTPHDMEALRDAIESLDEITRQAGLDRLRQCTPALKDVIYGR